MFRFRAVSVPRSAFRRTFRDSPPTWIALEDVRTAIVGANVAGPKGSLDGAHQSYTISANDQITAAATYRDIVVAFRNGAPVKISDLADVVDGLENTKVGAWYRGQPAIVHRRPAATWRKRDRDSPAGTGRTAAPAACDAGRSRSDNRQRSHHDDPRFHPRRSIHAGAEHCPRRARGVDIPAHDPRNHYRRRSTSALIDRNFRRDVVLRVFPRQPVSSWPSR